MTTWTLTPYCSNPAGGSNSVHVPARSLRPAGDSARFRTNQSGIAET
jgi:hypothetical protein